MAEEKGYLEGVRDWLHDTNVTKNRKALEMREEHVLGPIAQQYELILKKLFDVCDGYIKSKEAALKWFKNWCKKIKKEIEKYQNMLQEMLNELNGIKKELSELTNFDGIISDVFEQLPYLRRLLSEPIFWNTYDVIKLAETNVSGAIGDLCDGIKQVIKASVSWLLSNLDGLALPTDYFTYITNLSQFLYMKCISLGFLPSNIRPQVTNAYYWHGEGDADPKDSSKIAEAVPTFNSWQGVVVPIPDQEYIFDEDFYKKFSLSDPSTYYMLSPQSRKECLKGYDYWTSNFRDNYNPIMNSPAQFGRRHSKVSFALAAGKPTNHQMRVVPKYPAFDQWGNLLGYMEWPSEDFDPDKFAESGLNPQKFKTYSINGFRTTQIAVVTPQYTYVFVPSEDGNFYEYDRKVDNYISKSKPTTSKWSLMDIIYEIYAMCSDVKNLSIYGKYYEDKLNELFAKLGLKINTEQSELVQEADSNGRNADARVTLITDYTNEIKSMLDKLYSLRDELQAQFDVW